MLNHGRGEPTYNKVQSIFYFNKGVRFMFENEKHKKICRKCINVSKDGNLVCSISKIQNEQALLCFYRSVLNVPFKHKFFKYYRELLQNLAKCYFNLKCQNKSFLCYKRVVDIDNKLEKSGKLGTC